MDFSVTAQAYREVCAAQRLAGGHAHQTASRCVGHGQNGWYT